MDRIRLWKASLLVVTSLILASCGPSSSTSSLSNSGSTAGSTATATNSGAAVALDSIASVSLHVTNKSGLYLPGATVNVSGQTGTTDINGMVTIPGVKSGANTVISISDSGFLTQVINVSLGAHQYYTSTVALMDEAGTQTVANIEAAQTIVNQVGGLSRLQASISLPPNSLVEEATGTPATGTVNLRHTGIDVGTTDLLAMHGNSMAVNPQGTGSVPLISAGTMEVNFTSPSGTALQLASNTTATIQIDLPVSSVNNQNLVPGSTIPLWHFDTAQGLWVVNGTGTVVVSSTSPTGLAMKAVVPHFSSWNFDLQGGYGNSMNVYCVLPNGTPVACELTSQIFLQDGSQAYAHHPAPDVPASGVLVYYMPYNATVDWIATYQPSGTTTQYIGYATSITPGSQNAKNPNAPIGTQTITLTAAVSPMFVQCQSGGVGVACTVDAGIQTGKKVTQDLIQVPASGATLTVGSGVTAVDLLACSNAILPGAKNTTANLGQLFASGGQAKAIIPLYANSTFPAKATIPATCNPHPINN